MSRPKKIHEIEFAADNYDAEMIMHQNKGFNQGLQKMDDWWVKHIKEAPIESCLPSKEQTPFDMNAYAEKIRALLLKGE